MESPFRHCPGCGRAGPDLAGGKRLSCPACGYVFYLNAATACAAIIACGDEILLAARARDPGKGLLDLPGGFVDPGEGAEEGLLRELREELGLTLRAGDLRFLLSRPNRYEYAGVAYATCDLVFVAELAAKPALVAADDVAAVAWVRKAAVDLSRIAFPSIRAALETYLAPGR